MSAADHLQPRQLSMFMQAKELYRNTPSIDVEQTPNSALGGAWKTPEAMWKSKRKDNRAEGLDKHIAQHGVHAPVLLKHSDTDFGGEPGSMPRSMVISNGHHRTVAAYDSNPESYVPVEHEDYDQPRVRHSNTIQDAIADQHVTPGWTPKSRFPSFP